MEHSGENRKYEYGGEDFNCNGIILNETTNSEKQFETLIANTIFKQTKTD